MKQILEYFKDITFDEEKHVYYTNGNKIRYSVSSIVSMFKPEFDSETIAEGVATREGKTKEEILALWSKINKDACSLGTETHLFAETYAIDRTGIPVNGHQQAVVKFWNELPEYYQPLTTEIRMYHKEYHIAGTADLPLINTKTNQIVIADYKTNKDMFKSFPDVYLTKEFSHLIKNDYNTYQIQLSLYQLLMEQVPDVQISKRLLVWLLPDGNYKLYLTDDYTEVLKTYLKKKFNDNRRSNSKSSVPLL
jgi:hypothetical protein